MTSPPSLPPGYELIDGPPAAADYLALRQRSGLSPRRGGQAAPALRGSWAAVDVVRTASGATVGMGRVLGDGGWYFHVVDMAVLPEHQRRGLGDAILASLLCAIRRPGPRAATTPPWPGRAGRSGGRRPPDPT